MRTWWQTILKVVVAASCLSCGGSNYLTQMADKSSDDALYEDALKLVDVRDYTGALGKITAMTASGQARTSVRFTQAGAYAGRCGLDFLRFLDNAKGTTGTAFELFRTGFNGITLNIADCQSAQTLLETYGTTAAARITTLGTDVGTNLNTFMAVLGMAKIGVQLSAAADASPRDGTVDASFDACAMTQAQIAQVGTGFALILDNFTTIAAQLAGATSGEISSIGASCAAAAGGGSNPCTITDPTDSTWSNSILRNLIASLVKSNSIGIQSCANNPVFTCCP